jgi:hypothetical protein
MLERKDSMAECYGTNGLRKEHVLRPPFWTRYYIIFFFLWLSVAPIMQCVTVIIQLVSRDQVCRFENGSQMAE